MTEEREKNLNFRREMARQYIYIAIAVAFLGGMGSLFIAIFLVYIWPGYSEGLLKEIIHDRFRAVVGMPMIAAASFVIVWAFSVTQGAIEVEAWGLKFKGASGPVIFWIIVFLAISTSVNVAW